ncbi:50S ribosomal protein L16 [Patescibacteria group bacterium]
MLMMPRKVKHRKIHRGGAIKGAVNRGDKVSFGKYGLKAVTGDLISARQIEAARRAMTRYIQRGGKIWIRIFPDKPMTKSGDETPMGKGKGAVDHYVAKVRPGKVMFEMEGVERDVAKRAMELASYKLSVKTKFVEKN